MSGTTGKTGKAKSNRPVNVDPAAEEARKRKIALAISEKADRKAVEQLGPVKFSDLDENRALNSRSPDDWDGQRIIETFAINDIDAGNRLLGTLIHANCNSKRPVKGCVPNGLVALVHELEPRDAAEGMLCSQLVSTHALAMECISRANLPEQSFEGRDLNLRHAERLMRIFNQQIDTLNKHRGKGQQKVTVEHVTVNEGGQAVVGSLER